MRIAYLNPWRQAAENQCFKSLEQAAQRIGCELLHCCCSDEILAANPDFVLAVASTQPKLTGFPTYGVIHEPKDRFLSNRAYFTNLLSYDGYLTLSESIHVFLRALLSGMRRDDPIGCFYTTCQSNQLHTTQVANALKNKNAKLTYFGTHWDKRRHSFFKELSKLDNVEIYGPVHAWRHITTPAYKGPLPFDGEGPQKKYAENALGLVLMADKHLLDNVISNRIFEITSVGAVAICPRMPWIEEHYGDSVYYFNQLVPDDELLAQLNTIIADIHANPDDALRRAQRAQQIFCEQFSAEQLLKNACDYHSQRVHSKAHAKSGISKSPAPLINVILRAEALSENLDRALSSIASQTAGRFSVLIVRGADFDLTSLRNQYHDRFFEFRVLDCFHENRAQMLWHGLKNVTAEYFCILDDNHEWMPNHIEHLLPEASSKKPLFSYSGSIRVARDPVLTGEKIPERRFISSFGDCRTVGFFEAVEFFSSNCFLASSDLLDRFNLQSPNIRSCEDTLLILELLSKTEPHFNHRATAIHHELENSSDSQNQSGRARDQLEVVCRLAGKVPSWPIVPDIYPALSAKVAAFFEEEARRHNWKVNVAAAPALPAALSPRAVRGPESLSQWRIRTFGRWHRSLHKRFPKLFPKTDDRPRHSQQKLGVSSRS